MPNIRRNIEDLVNDPRGYLTMLADRLQNASKGRRAIINDQGAGYRNLTQQERLQAVQQAALDNLGGGGLGIIKAKGGNWLTGSVENALSGLKKAPRNPWGEPAELININGTWVDNVTGAVLDPEEIARIAPTQALNKWIEGPLTKYVKRDMATEGDPVRKLAEQGILHYEPHMPMGMDEEIVSSVRKLLGYPESGKAKTDLGNRWEHHSDNAIDTYTAGNVAKSGYKVDNPWVANLEPTTPIHEYKNGFVNDIGFGHLTDELYNALNPESGLPRHLQLTPEQMQQLGMEKAVRHVHDINQWRAAQKAEANAKLAQSPAVHMVREYAENNPKGLRWVELKQPKDLPEDFEMITDTSSPGMPFYQYKTPSGGMMQGAYTPEEALKNAKDSYLRRVLGDQLKYEGDTMGHCVGGYCDRVLGGEARIFSLRDAKGEPHVTIETRPGDETQSIVQIKGKQNLKPKDEYLPFVQDFVRNHPEGGKWGDIGDLQNTGLRRTRDAWNDMEQARIREAGHEIPDYLSIEEIQQLGEKVWPGQWGKTNYAQGGSVQGNTTWRPMELDGIIGYITE